MTEIARAGVDEVVSSWWGLGSPEADRLPTLMRAAWKHGLDVAVHLEPYEKWQRTRAIVEADFEYLRELGVGRVYVYFPFDGLIAESAWLELSARFPSIELYAQTRDAARAAGAGFDGVYTYDVYAVRGGAFAGFCARATRAGIACAPSVGPGYNASRATPDHRVRSRRAGKTYDGMWRAAIAADPDRVTITSYNEWHEGTQIEPARQTSGHDPRRVRELRGSVRPHGRGGREGVPRPHGVLDEDVSRCRGGHRGAEADKSVPVRLARAQINTSAAQLVTSAASTSS